MDTIIDAIKAALAADATDEARAAGAVACRMVLATLEPSSATEPGATPAGATPALPIAELAAALRGIPMDQLLDVAIARLRAALPAGTIAPDVRPLHFRLLRVPQRGGAQ